eukprot:TRINITY_DN20343_c0_g2_i1.p1 TRINITY_DN20343_c0_g2~~TRINITY_DN20343_c0_g2_i1.p1  ORF type:complete len:437 (+),score=107.36 TRINITY_DN20343_c0_g2_i1:72-1382(+)
MSAAAVYPSVVEGDIRVLRQHSRLAWERRRPREGSERRSYRWFAKQALLAVCVLELLARSELLLLGLLCIAAVLARHWSGISGGWRSTATEAKACRRPLGAQALRPQGVAFAAGPLVAPHHGRDCEEAASPATVADAPRLCRATPGSLFKAAASALTARRLLVAAIALEVLLKVLERGLAPFFALLRAFALLAALTGCVRYTWLNRERLAALSAVVQYDCLAAATQVAMAQDAARQAVRRCGALLFNAGVAGSAALADSAATAVWFVRSGSAQKLAQQCPLDGAAGSGIAVHALEILAAALAVATSAESSSPLWLLGRAGAAAGCVAAAGALSRQTARPTSLADEPRGRTAAAPRRKRSASPPPAAPASKVCEVPAPCAPVPTAAAPQCAEVLRKLLAYVEAAFTLAVTANPQASSVVLEKRGVQLPLVGCGKAKM